MEIRLVLGNGQARGWVVEGGMGGGCGWVMAIRLVLDECKVVGDGD